MKHEPEFPANVKERKSKGDAAPDDKEESGLGIGISQIAREDFPMGEKCDRLKPKEDLKRVEITGSLAVKVVDRQQPWVAHESVDGVPYLRIVSKDGPEGVMNQFENRRDSDFGGLAAI